MTIQQYPELFEAGDDWQGNHVLAEEVFGPLGLVITVKNAAQMLEIARSFLESSDCYQEYELSP